MAVRGPLFGRQIAMMLITGLRTVLADHLGEGGYNPQEVWGD